MGAGRAVVVADLLLAEKVSASERLQRLALALGDAAVQIKGTEFVREQAPHLIPLLDNDQNGVLSLPELLSLDLEDPATLVLLVAGESGD